MEMSHLWCIKLSFYGNPIQRQTIDIIPKLVIAEISLHNANQPVEAACAVEILFLHDTAPLGICETIKSSHSIHGEYQQIESEMVMFCVY